MKKKQFFSFTLFLYSHTTKICNFFKLLIKIKRMLKTKFIDEEEDENIKHSCTVIITNTHTQIT